MRLSKKISILLLRKGLNQESLAEALDISQATVSRWISGVKPHKSTALKIAYFFNVPVEILLDDETELPDLRKPESFKTSDRKPVDNRNRRKRTVDAGDRLITEISDEEMNLWFENNPEEAKAVLRGIGKSYENMKKTLEDFENMIMQMKDSTERYKALMKKHNKRHRRQSN